MPLSTTTPLALPAAPEPALHPPSDLASMPASVHTAGPSRPPRLPGDHGLAAAGLVAQAAGTIGMGLSLFASMSLVLSGDIPRASRTLFLVAAFIGTIRSVAHILAGLSLAKRSPRLFRHVSIYGAIAVLHTVVLAVALLPLHALPLFGPVTLPALVAVSLGWPLVFGLLVLRAANRRLLETATGFELAILSNDRGVAHAGVLMVAGGMFMAAAYGVVLVLGVVDGGLTLATLVVLLVRSLVHVGAGLAALARPSVRRFESLVAIYRAAAIIATLMVVATVLGKGTGGAFGFLFLVVLAMSWLLGWPFALTGFARQVRALEPSDHHRTDAADGAASERRLPAASDRGLTALGYLLVWLGTLVLGTAVGAVGDPHVPAWVALLQLVSAGLFVWAGVELALMTRRWRLAALVFAGVTLVLGVVVLMAPFVPLEGMGGGMQSLFSGPTDGEIAQRWMGALAAIVLPLVTLALVLRVPRASRA